MAFASFLPRLSAPSWWLASGLSYATSDDARFARYERYRRTYLGYAVRGTHLSAVVDETKKIKFNFARSIANLAAAFLASKPLGWKIEGDPEATKRAADIWDRSIENGGLIEAALACAILGDLAVVATRNPQQEAVLEFVDPGICFPTFSGKNCSELTFLEIAYEDEDREGRRVRHRELYFSDHLEVYEDNTLVDTRRYDAMPVAWVVNTRLKGQSFGISDLDGIVDLVLEYDHLATKQTAIVDYYAAPTPVISGMAKSSTDIEKNLKSVWFLPDPAAKAYFLEHEATNPDVEAQLTRIRNAISEVSQVPAIAFGQHDSGLSAISGVAMQILYGPLLAKTQAKRGPFSAALEAMMTVALQAEGVSIEAHRVKAVWADPLPQDVTAQLGAEVQKVTNDLSSLRSSMSHLGVDSPEEELKRIAVEKVLLSLVDVGAAGSQPQAPPQPGAFGQENAPAPEPPKPDEMLSSESDRVTALLQAIDRVLATESVNLEAEEKRLEQAGS